MVRRSINIGVDIDTIDKLDKLAIKRNTSRSELINTILRDNIEDYDNKDINISSSNDTILTATISKNTMSKLNELHIKYNSDRCKTSSIGHYLTYLINETYKDHNDKLKTLRDKINNIHNKNSTMAIDTKRYIDSKCSILKQNIKWFQNVIDNLNTSIEFKNTRNKDILQNYINRVEESLNKFNTSIDNFNDTIIIKK